MRAAIIACFLALCSGDRTDFRILSSTRHAMVVVLSVMAFANLYAQNGLLNPVFEVASIKVNTSGKSDWQMRKDPGGRLTATNATVHDLIANAYGARRMVGEPDWLRSDRFDISAKATGDPSPQAIVDMFRNLLSERFRLRFHVKTTDVPIYALVLARADGRVGPNLIPSQLDCDAVEARQSAGLKPCNAPASGTHGDRRIRGGAMSMAAFASMLSNVVDRDVKDYTALRGTFDIDLSFGAIDLSANSNSGESIFTALTEQLGLRLKPARGPVEVLVIDHVEHPSPD